METHKGLKVFEFENAGLWLTWLEDNHGQTESIWLKVVKKGTGARTINYEEAREGALMFGWIDSLPNKYDVTYYLLKLSPRRKGSVWSKINRDICERLINEGRMRPSGLQEVEAAKADGRWDAAYEGQANVVAPDDLLKALSKNKNALKTYEATNNTNRSSIIFQVQTAKKPETRQRRIEKYVAMLENGEVPYPSKKVSK